MRNARQASGESDAEGSGCAFVLDDDRGEAGGGGFCDAPRRQGSVYCEEHHSRCHLTGGSGAERQRLREIEALATAVGGRRGRQARRPPPYLLRRLDRIARTLSRHDRSLNVLRTEDAAE